MHHTTGNHMETLLWVVDPFSISLFCLNMQHYVVYYQHGEPFISIAFSPCVWYVDRPVIAIMLSPNSPSPCSDVDLRRRQCCCTQIDGRKSPHWLDVCVCVPPAHPAIKLALHLSAPLYKEWQLCHDNWGGSVPLLEASSRAFRHCRQQKSPCPIHVSIVMKNKTRS